ncbi:TIGR03013 family XrtA/PEP-CTERM system glycosyltransferase [Herbaspirillum robiniae]|uniref:Exopolysaccharide biosynthesis polyprenyl glycosylphosphotransferase n=1 Tax=Herbaspirillum robiniae TaxID=2014887 RepID=A0A2D0B6S0_9BURK|nr:TIGR03013 family XrtA/PEP-CTERM system glycosyltransferase [Herbaspirillum robiniae]NUU01788.1 TIGR03013 family PEP-CTERM/XrtA system glycosyltransferase [Herbaspirillum robiniae]OWY29831.1 exopolysaccharide biosynthesis polyprenyl glycosylphosphotransferase [Herbaspirillum robiniae]
MLRISNHYVSKVVTVLLVLEFGVMFLAGYIGVNLRFMGEYAQVIDFHKFLMPMTVVAMSIAIGMSAVGMYQRNIIESPRLTFLRLMPSFGIALLMMLVIFYAAPDISLGRGVLAIVLLLSAIGVFGVRTIFFKLVNSRMLVSPILFLGSSELVKDCIETSRNNVRNHKYNIVGSIPVAGEDSSHALTVLVEPAGTLLETARKYKAEEIVVAVQNRRGGALRIQELLECKMKGVRVTDAAGFFEREACQIRLDSLHPSWLVFGSGFDQSLIRTFMKRAFDVIISALMLPLLSPVMLAAVVSIWLEDRGPILYRQERVGKNGETFLVLKFRSMRVDAEQAGMPQWASSNDPRITAVGNVMRKFRVDELPQLFNVLRGDMSFVGPRPERPFFVQQFADEIAFYNVRHSVKPGITGWAQVRYKYGSSKDDAVQKLQYDLYYVKNNSLFLDMLILIDTLNVVIFGAGT